MRAISKKNELFYLDSKPNKENQKALSMGIKFATSYMIKMGASYDQLDAQILADMIYAFFKLGIGVQKADDGNIFINFFDCYKSFVGNDNIPDLAKHILLHLENLKGK